MARAAAATALLNRELSKLSGSSTGVSRSTQNVNRDTNTLAKEANKANSEVNKLESGMSLMVTAAITLGPALIPIAAVGVPAVTSLANAFGAVALAGATVMVAFHGVGDALKAVDTASVTPSTANLLKMHQALDELSPAAQDFVKQLHNLEPQLSKIRDAGAANLFPGLSQSIDILLTRLPDVQRIVAATAQGLSHTLTAGAADLASSRWDSFFRFLSEEAPKTLISIGHITGDIAHGLAQMWMAFQPLNNGFTGWLVQVADGFDRWATGLSQTSGFAEFMNYIRTAGPEVLALTESLANALLQVVEAAAPLGGPILASLTAFLNVVAKIADSDLGTPIMAAVIAMRLLSVASLGYNKAAKTSFGASLINPIKGATAEFKALAAAEQQANLSLLEMGRAAPLIAKNSTAIRGGAIAAGKGIAAFAGLALAASGVADKFGLTNTASLGLIGTMGGPWGVAVGIAAGATLDLVHSNDQLDASLAAVQGTINSGSVPAMARLRNETQGMLNTWNQQTDSKGGFAGVIDSLVHLPGNAFALFSGSVDRAQGSVDQLNSAMESARLGGTALAHAMAGPLLQNLGLTGHGFQTAGDSASQFATSVQLANNVLTKRGSLRDYQAALDAFSAAVKANGKSMDITTAKGRNVQAALDGIASNALTAAQNLSGLSRTRFMDQARKDFIGAAIDLGKTRDQAKKLADQLGLVDQIKAQPKVQLQGMVQLNANLDELNAHFNVIDHLMGGPTVKVAGVTTGISLIDNLLRQLQLVNGYTATTYIVTHHSNTYGGPAGGGGHSVGTPGAHGRVLDFYAAGDIRDRHVAEIAPAGSWRVWAEPETKGESYIPLADDWRRPRAQDIWRETGRRLGMQFMEFARGAVISAPMQGREVARTSSARFSGPVEVRGRVDIATGSLVGTMRMVADQAIDESNDFNDTMRGRRAR